MKKTIATALSVTIALAGCAVASKDITAYYVSPLKYQSYDCDQLAGEMGRIQIRVTQLGGRLDEAATNDKIITGAGILLFWPALIFLGGTKQQEQEYSILKGEYEAVEQAAVANKCATTLAPTPPVSDL